jgi:methylthioribose-1-phosphate isomerase
MSIEVKEGFVHTLQAYVKAGNSLKSSDLIKCFTPILWEGSSLRLIDQRKLPVEEVELVCSDWQITAKAIKDMVVRGAPAIGITAAYGLVLAAQGCQDLENSEQIKVLMEAAEGLAQTRPTAVNLFWAIDRMSQVWKGEIEHINLSQALEIEAVAIHLEDIETCRAMGAHGAALLGDQVNLLTHCNTGALATGGHGTALGVIRSAHEQGKLNMVYADETRPFWQGARLTAWELHKDSIPVKVICDSMSAHFMSLGAVDAVFVGADRIAANGDTANKIGTYLLAIAAAAHQVPFYVVAPKSTIDLATVTGRSIPIEQRPNREVTHCGEQRVVPVGVEVENPAFDVTPARLITAIITENGVIPQDHFTSGLAALFSDHSDSN